MKDPALSWLLDPNDPSVRYQALIDLFHRPKDGKDVLAARDKIPSYRPVKKITATQTSKGIWSPKETCYRPKCTSAVWHLALLGEMDAPPDPRISSECERFLDLHQTETGAFACPSKVEESKRWDEPCLTGNMIRTLIKFGYSNDPRVQRAIDWLPKDQLEDGGWNCNHPEKKVKHSSFMSTIEPLWAYSEIPRAKWTRKMKWSAEQGAEFLLMHRVYKSDHHHWKHSLPFATSLHFPMYYYYDALHGLRVLAKLGYGDDERVRDAVHLILSKRSPDGKWLLEGDWSREPEAQANKRKALVEVEELWKPSKWITLKCSSRTLSSVDLPTIVHREGLRLKHATHI